MIFKVNIHDFSRHISVDLGASWNLRSPGGTATGPPAREVPGPVDRAAERTRALDQAVEPDPATQSWLGRGLHTSGLLIHDRHVMSG